MMINNNNPQIQLAIICVFLFFSYAIKAEASAEQLYMQNCMVCHADDGSGAMPGVSDLTKNRNWSTIPESQLLARLNKGIQTASSAVNMPPKGGNPNLNDKDLIAIISYMRKEFLN